jgi:ubiquinone/menaquinone biosynthesis C-methylase UbiE
MKKLFPQQLNPLQLSSILTSVKTQAAKLLPSTDAQKAVQLPIPLTPFDRYRRRKLIQMLNLKSFAEEKSVLEVGCGVGDLLKEVSQFNPKELYGVDASADMIKLARQFLKEIEADLWIAKPSRLPFPEKSFDLVIVMFELQYLADKDALEKVIFEACRVSRQWVVLVEDTAVKVQVKEDHICRPVEAYKEEFKRKKFHLRKTTYLYDSASRFFFTGGSSPLPWIRWVLSPILYLMGFPKSWMKPPIGQQQPPDSKFAILMQKLTLPFLSSLDELFRSGTGITAMYFERERLFRRG